jgi:hypothetical protein
MKIPDDVAADRSVGARPHVMDMRVGLGTVLQMIVIIAGAIWAVAMMSAEINAMRDEMGVFKADVAQQFLQLHADFSGATERLDSRIDAALANHGPGR